MVKARETVTIYTKLPDETGPCPYCDRAKAWLQERNVPYHEIQLDTESRQELYDEMSLKGSERTVPQIVVQDCEGERHQIGGFEQLTESQIHLLFSDENPFPVRELPPPQIEIWTAPHLKEAPQDFAMVWKRKVDVA